MKVTTRVRYSLRALLMLAHGHGGPPIPMRALVQDEGLSRKYLHALLTGLKSAGLVRSVRGVHGGFVLAKAPSDIRLSDIFLAVEGPFSLVDCVGDPASCDRSTACIARETWQHLSESIEHLFEQITLEGLLARETKALSKSTGVRRRASRAQRRPGRSRR
ncbi:MAG: Rrf2 family transcriptional regulator [bacterium]|nr:Rrf2 family transcriptional regulator [bacterium]